MRDLPAYRYSCIVTEMKDTLVIDFETKKSFAEVGGEEYKRDLGISVAGVYSYAKDVFFAFEERELGKLEDMLEASGHVIGFNLKHFDLPVLEPYLERVAIDAFAVTDMYLDAVAFLGHRVGLNALAKSTLGVEKSGHGLDALQWFKEGKIEQVKRYCLDDVRITRDLYEYGKAHGFLLFESYVDGKTHSIPVSWDKAPKSVSDTVEEAFAARRRLEIEYVSSEDRDQMGFRKKRLIDIYELNGESLLAYCHLRKEPRKFFLRRIVKAELTPDSYVIPRDLQPALF